MITKTDIDVFFGGLESRLEGAAEYRTKAARLIGSDFSVFRFINYEYQFSKILADILDPMGSHGQGGALLGRFLDLLENRSSVPSASVMSELRERMTSRRVSVRREQVTDGGRLIDIVLSEGDIGIGIENKPWVADQNRQLSDYAKYLSRYFSGGWMLLYVSGAGNPPATQSLSSDERQVLLNGGNYLELSYAADLAEWLSACIHACDADKVRWFLRDFQDFSMTKFKIAQPSGETSDG